MIVYCQSNVLIVFVLTKTVAIKLWMIVRSVSKMIVVV